MKLNAQIMKENDLLREDLNEMKDKFTRLACESDGWYNATIEKMAKIDQLEKELKKTEGQLDESLKNEDVFVEKAYEHRKKSGMLTYENKELVSENHKLKCDIEELKKKLLLLSEEEVKTVRQHNERLLEDLKKTRDEKKIFEAKCEIMDAAYSSLEQQMKSCENGNQYKERVIDNITTALDAGLHDHFPTDFDKKEFFKELFINATRILS